jgi:basic membrane lipoprotein Med (substrate-binding protein (PBP1-ABC) superfamily)
VYAFGHFNDQHSLNPDLVLTSPIALWDPAFMTMVDAWWAYKTEGTPYDGPMERILFYMPGGGSGLGTISDSVPADVLAIVEETREKIMSGELVLEINAAPIEG